MLNNEYVADPLTQFPLIRILKYKVNFLRFQQDERTIWRITCLSCDVTNLKSQNFPETEESEIEDQFTTIMSVHDGGGAQRMMMVWLSVYVPAAAAGRALGTYHPPVTTRTWRVGVAHRAVITSTCLPVTTTSTSSRTGHAVTAVSAGERDCGCGARRRRTRGGRGWQPYVIREKVNNSCPRFFSRGLSPFFINGCNYFQDERTF